MDGLLSYVDEIGIIVAICFFFFGINQGIKNLTEAIGSLQQELKDARASGSKEHQMMVDTLSENQKVMIDSMNRTSKEMAEEHKEMIQISGKQNELLVSIREKLTAHVNEK